MTSDSPDSISPGADSPESDPIAEIRSILLGSTLDEHQASLKDLRQRLDALGGRSDEHALVSADVASRLANLARATDENETRVRAALERLEEHVRELAQGQRSLEERLAQLECSALARDEFQQIIRDVSKRLGGDA